MGEQARGAYQSQDSRQTLREGLGEYYRLNPGKVTVPERLPAASRSLFLSHDVCHVVFGLSTSLEDEGMADLRTVLSTDVGLRAYLAYLSSDPQAKALFAQLGWVRGVSVTIRLVPRMLRGALERLRMRRRWPWRPPAEFMDRPLDELRRDYRIRVI